MTKARSRFPGAGMKARPSSATKLLLAIRRFELTTIALILFGMSSLAYCAGLDCAKADSSVEKIICTNSSLSKQDGALSRLYSWVLEEAPSVTKPKIIASQKAWIAQKRDVCTNAECLSEVYGARIKELAIVRFNNGSATYVSDASEIDRITRQIGRDLREVGVTQPLGACSHILFLASHSNSYGAFCNLGNRKSVEVCDENVFGNLAVNFYGFTMDGASLAAFTQAVCPGG